jgi:hypothetical protein
MATKEISVAIKAKDAASAVFKKLSSEVNGLAFSFQKIDMAFKSFNRLGTEFINAGTKMFFAGGGIVAGFELAIKKASDFNEIQEKFNETMGESAQTAEGFSKTLVNSYGMSEKGAKSFMSTFGDIFQTMGISSKETASLSNEFVKLGSDLAAFKKIKTEDAMESLRAAAVGTFKGLKNLGIIITEDEIKQKAFSMGLAKTGEGLSFAAKQSALLALLLSKSSGAIGATQRNFNSLEDQVERLKNRFDDFVTGIGKGLIPMIEKFITRIEPIINKLIVWVGANQDLVSGFAKIGLALGGLLVVSGSFNIVFGTILKSLASLPKLGALAYAGLFNVTRGILSLSSIIVANPMIIPLALLGTAIYKTIDAWVEYKQAVYDAISANAEFQMATAAVVPDIVKFNRETGNQAKTIADVSRLAREQGLVLSQQSGKWQSVNAKVTQQSRNVSILGTVYKQLKDAAISALDSTKNKIDELDKKIKQSAFEKMATADKFATITADIMNKALEDKGDTLGAWNNRFNQANQMALQAADMIRKASQEQDKVIREELLNAAQSKIDAGVNVAQSISDAVKQTNVYGNEQIVQSAEVSRKKALQMINTFKQESDSITDLNRKADEATKGILEEALKNINDLLATIPETIDTKVKVEIDKQSYDRAMTSLKLLAGNKTLKFDISGAGDSNADYEGFATGGALSGYGGGDRIAAKLEPGEFVIRKESVRKYGLGLFAALNALNIPGRIKEKYGGMSFNLPQIPRMAFATGGPVPSMKNFGTIDLTVKGQSYPVMGDVSIIESLKQAIIREKLMGTR